MSLYCIHLLAPCTVSARSTAGSPPLRLLPQDATGVHIPESTVRGSLKYGKVDGAESASGAKPVFFPLRASHHGFYLGTSRERLQELASLLGDDLVTGAVDSLPIAEKGAVLLSGEIRSGFYFEEFRFNPVVSNELRGLSERLAQLLSQGDRALSQKLERGIAVLTEEQLCSMILVGCELLDRVPSLDLNKHQVVQYLPAETILFGSITASASTEPKVLFLGGEESSGKGLSRFITNFTPDLSSRRRGSDQKVEGGRNESSTAESSVVPEDTVEEITADMVEDTPNNITEESNADRI